MSAVRHALRPATLHDVEPVAALLREAKFKARSAAGWRWLFQDNPAHRRQDPPPEMGWVLEHDGALNGYLGNIHLDYVLDGRPVRAATCTSYYVRPDARTEATRLMTAFFRQPGVELYLSTTANAQSDPVYRLFKAAAPADPSFFEGLVWVADDRVALQDTFAKAGLPSSVAGAFAAATAPASKLARALTGFATVPGGAGAEPVALVDVADIDARFDRLWARIADTPGLRVRRDAAALRWYFSDPDAGGAPKLFVVSDAEGLVGYAAAARHRPPGAGTAQLRILDLVVRPDGERVVPALVERMLAYARETGCGLLYSAPCGAALAERLKALRPYPHRHDYAAHFLRSTAKGETVALAGHGVWQATALDGDTPFCIEHESR